MNSLKKLGVTFDTTNLDQAITDYRAWQRARDEESRRRTRDYHNIVVR